MTNDEKLRSKTLRELQALAKTRGLKRYSKLTKEQLTRLLVQAVTPTTTGRTKKPRTRKSARTVQSTTPAKSPTAPLRSLERIESASTAVAPPSSTASSAPVSATEEWVEQTKYASRPNGRAPAESMTDLGEDIDRLPPLDEPVVCLLSQKPGVLHAYWVLPSGDEGARNDYKLRLCRISNDAVEIFEEVAVQARVGSWYFHVSGANNMQVQIGYYQDGRFVAARGRSVAQLPSLYASTRTDERWWVSDADFMRMYLRAGGFATADRFGWKASVGSPGGAPSSGERLTWPGGVSSS
jgi:Rho termination factor, N-terminal domain